MVHLQEIIVSAIDIPAFIFHLSLIVLITIKLYKKDAKFVGGLYHLFVIIAIIDAIGYFFVSLLEIFI